jgi:hypothetical protein
MNVAQVSIELILAGILALCAFVLPLWTGTEFSRDFLQSNAFFGILGIAYLFGVVFDKLADTILNPFEKFKRLQKADEYLSKHPQYKKDPYPQNRLEFQLRKAKDGRLEWMDSLKSRIRTSRELAVLGLPATMGIVLYENVAKGCTEAATCPSRWSFFSVGINVVLVFAAVLISKRHAKMPTTDQLKTDQKERAAQITHARKQMHIYSSVYYLMMINSLVAIGFVAVGNWEVAVIGLGGVAMTVLGLWTWNSITGTYLKFLAREMTNLRKEEK